MIRFLLPALLLFTFSCSRQNQSASRVSPVFDTQVRNAVNMVFAGGLKPFEIGGRDGTTEITRRVLEALKTAEPVAT